MTQLLYKEEKEQQQQSPAFINFIESLSESKATRRSYREQLNKFMEFHKDPQDLLLWDSKVIENKIIQFVVA
ncbi:MAG TPA: hypothetical protein VIP70_04285 [Nitrososphaeraceae archaeon]